MLRKILRFFIIPFFVAVFISFFVSYVSFKFGDKMLIKDKFASAEMFFSISKIINPFNPSVKNRLQAVSVLLTERTLESKEINNLHELANLPIKNFVLGVSTQVPVLMYHYIRVNPYPGDIVGFNLSVTPENFSRQLDWLSTHGYHPITLDNLGANLLYKVVLPPKPVILTFDDGYSDFYTTAFPILKDHKIPAVNFVITGFVGIPKYLTWDEISEMKNSGLITFGAHTVYHQALTYLSDSEALMEMAQSKKDLESHLGYPVNWLAYPYGNVNPRIAALAKQAGFIGAFGTEFGTSESTDTLFTEPRVRVGGGDNATSLGSRLPWQ